MIAIAALLLIFWCIAAFVAALVWVLRNEIKIVQEREAAERDWNSLMRNTPHCCTRGHNWVGPSVFSKPWLCPPCPTCGRMCIVCDDDPEEACC